MNPVYKRFFEPFILPASGVELKNRLVMAPMTTWSGNSDGTITDRELEYYHKRSGGVGLVITACAYVIPHGQGFHGQIGIHNDDMIPSLKKIADVIHKRGAKAVMQIYHGGRMCAPELVPGNITYSASAVPAVIPGSAVPREMTGEQIEETIGAFGEAARRVIDAGYDGVEIHGANTYLIQQFFSPHSNRRNDKWGGDVNSRMTFPLAVADAVLEKVKKHAKRPFVVGYRLSPEEIENPGIIIDDTLRLVDKLAERNLDYIHVSTMKFFGGSLRDKEDKRAMAAVINDRIGSRVPVIGVGSVHTPADALKIIEAGIPLVAMGRELLMEPQWVEKVLAGEEKTIRITLPRTPEDELVIPDNMWNILYSRKGWLPLDEN